MWTELERPGYFGRRRDEIIKRYNEVYGKNAWRLVWRTPAVDRAYEFYDACVYFYEHSYYFYLKDHPEDVEFITSFDEVIDNAPTNVDSGMDYRVQEAYSTHIQDIAIRNALDRLGVWFKRLKGRVLVVRSKDSEGFKYGPGNIPFVYPDFIRQPSLCPSWANTGSVEDFWQSNKVLEILK